MASFDSDSDREDFEGFTNSDIEALNTGNNAEEDEDSESDISISTVNTEDLSDFSVSDVPDVDEVDVQWNSRHEEVHVDRFRADSGPVSGVAEDGTAIDFFNLIFTEDLFEHIVEETNRYARQCIAVKPDPKWCETTTEEMKAFVGLHVLFGIKHLPSTRLYWSKDPFLGVPEVQKVMPRNRFDKLLQYLHVNDSTKALPREHLQHDKLFKIRPILDRVLEACQSEYRPTKNVSVDEAMVKFKGRLGMKQYMPNKPVKRGIKVWEAADASNGYVFDFQVYTGKKQDGAEHGLGYRVVHDLTRQITGKNHHVFCDNFFTSVKLAEDLLADKIYLCGTIRANREGYPKELRPKEPEAKRLKQGESMFRRKNNLVATVWRDKRIVNFLSSQSNPVGNDTVSRKQRDGSIIQVASAPVVNSYNKNMGGVDHSDQLRGYYAISPKSKKWWRYLFWFCVDLSIVNAYILETLARNHLTRRQLSFRLELAKNLIGNFSSRKLSVSAGRLEGGHWPIPYKKGLCKRCLKKSERTWCRLACQLCNKRVCLACFPNHSATDLG